MQQRELGLSIDAILDSDPELQRCLAQLLKTAPELFQSNSTQILREAEHQRSFAIQSPRHQSPRHQGYLLTVIYDLLIAEASQAHIIDWKTYPRPRSQQELIKNWQTRLYLYTLVETGNYSPEQVSMTYWFVRSKQHQPPESLQFFYNHQWHQQNHQDLNQLLDKLEQHLSTYDQGQDLQQVSLSQGYCKTCQFAVRCQRTEASLTSPTASDSLPDFARIKEVPI